VARHARTAQSSSCSSLVLACHTIAHSGGSYRNVFRVNIPDTREVVVFKECVYDDHSFNYEYYEFMRYVLYSSFIFISMLPALFLRNDSHTPKIRNRHFRMDGAVGEIVTNHPLFAETYGFCALSLLSESMQKGDLDAIAVPKYERCKETFVHQNLDGRKHLGGQLMSQFKKMNSLSVTEKLELSLQMAGECQGVTRNTPVCPFLLFPPS
jgi:hypothetical protein